MIITLRTHVYSQSVVIARQELCIGYVYLYNKQPKELQLPASVGFSLIPQASMQFSHPYFHLHFCFALNVVNRESKHECIMETIGQ